MISVVSQIGFPKKGKKISFIQNDPKTNRLIKLLVEEPKLCLELTELTSKTKDFNKVLQSLIYVLSVNSPIHAVQYTQDMLVKSLSSDSLISANSIALRTFSVYMNVVGCGFIGAIITNFYRTISTTDDQKLNSDRSAELILQLSGQIAQSLDQLPPVLAGFLITAFKTLKPVLSAQQACAEVLKLFFDGCVCPAIDSPDLYLLIPAPPKKKEKKSLSLISELLSHMVNQTKPKDQKFSEFLQTEYTTISRAFLGWLSAANAIPPFDPFQSKSPKYSWIAEEEALRLLHALLVEHSEQINTRLGPTGSCKEVTFRLSEFVDALVSSQSSSTTPTGKHRNTSVF